MNVRFLLLLTSAALLVSPALAQDESPQDDSAQDTPDAEQTEETEPAELTPEEQAAIDRARELFLEGVEHYESHDLDAAITAFAEAMTLHDAPTIRYNLAHAYADQRKHVEAYRHVIVLQARDDIEPNLLRDINRLERSIRGRVGRIDLRSSDEIDEVRLDGETTEAGLLAVEPGAHVIEGFRNGVVAVRREVDVARRERVTVDLAVVTVREVVETPGTPAPRDPAPLRRGLGISAAIVAVAAVVVAIVATRGPDPVRGNLEPGTIRW